MIKKYQTPNIKVDHKFLEIFKESRGFDLLSSVIIGEV